MCHPMYVCIYTIHTHTHTHTHVNMVIHHHRRRYVNKLDLSFVADRRDARGSSMGIVPKKGRKDEKGGRDQETERKTEK